MKIFSTFAGIGGFEVGISNAFKTTRLLQGINHKIGETAHDKGLSTEPFFVGYSEIDKYAISVYERNFKGVKNYGDITQINAEELPEFDCLVGGFPCQPFSLAGKRRGLEDTRGTLFFDLARILQAKQPRLFVFENVKGLLSDDGGRTFRTIVRTLTELGYDCQWQVLNSKDFGVPQHRERIIIVGHLRGSTRPKVFPFEFSNRMASEEDTKIRSIAQTLTATYNKGGKGQHVSEDGFARRLTPLECERLQGFPDNWTAFGSVEVEGAEGLNSTVMISDTQRYKMCGNAVTTNVIQAVFERIIRRG